MHEQRSTCVKVSMHGQDMLHQCQLIGYLYTICSSRDIVHCDQFNCFLNGFH